MEPGLRLPEHGMFSSLAPGLECAAPCGHLCTYAAMHVAQTGDRQVICLGSFEQEVDILGCKGAGDIRNQTLALSNRDQV